MIEQCSVFSTSSFSVHSWYFYLFSQEVVGFLLLLFQIIVVFSKLISCHFHLKTMSVDIVLSEPESKRKKADQQNFNQIDNNNNPFKHRLSTLFEKIDFFHFKQIHNYINRSNVNTQKLFPGKISIDRNRYISIHVNNFPYSIYKFHSWFCFSFVKSKHFFLFSCLSSPHFATLINPSKQNNKKLD